MNAAGVRVSAAGLLTTVQDLGRWGHQAEGVPVSGAMDGFAHRLANALVGNRPDAATLEATLVGPELVFGDDRRVAMAGAMFEVTVDGIAAPHEASFMVPRGGVLRFGERVHGARAYLAIEGGIDVPRVLGSRATHLPSAMGGHEGRALRRGDQLPLGPCHGAPASATLARKTPTSAPTHPARVRLLPGPQQHLFTDDALAVLGSAPYRVGVESNRVGYRLEGPRLTHRDGADVLSDATPVGVVQVPGSGQPVLLMADRQTTGGYAKVATVITADLPVVAQLAPGDWLVFEPCTRAAALTALIRRERQLLALEACS